VAHPSSVRTGEAQHLRQESQLGGAEAFIRFPHGAHPHVFIDADATLIFSRSGKLQAVRLTWSYDEFFSLMRDSNTALR